MKKLFVEKTIHIEAPAVRVWDVLTKPEFTDQWAKEFSGGTDLHIVSEWKQGNPVLWNNPEGKVVVEGTVTAIDPQKLLRFTVADTRFPKPEFKEEDGITFELQEEVHDHDSFTTLHVLQGDFEILPDGAKYKDATELIWNHVLPKIKELAERV